MTQWPHTQSKPSVESINVIVMLIA